MRAYRLPVRGSGHQGIRRSPEKRVRRVEDEQRNVRMFGAKRRTEQNEVCEDEKPPLVRRANFGTATGGRPIRERNKGRTESSAPTGAIGHRLQNSQITAGCFGVCDKQRQREIPYIIRANARIVGMTAICRRFRTLYNTRVRAYFRGSVGT